MTSIPPSGREYAPESPSIERFRQDVEKQLEYYAQEAAKPETKERVNRATHNKILTVENDTSRIKVGPKIYRGPSDAKTKETAAKVAKEWGARIPLGPSGPTETKKG